MHANSLNNYKDVNFLKEFCLQVSFEPMILKIELHETFRNVDIHA